MNLIILDFVGSTVSGFVSVGGFTSGSSFLL
jgi:hypothetical protein